MLNSIKREVSYEYLQLIIYYVETVIKNYVPDHHDVDLALRMVVLEKLRTRLLKRQAEVTVASKLRITIPKDEALALLAQWMDGNLFLTDRNRIMIGLAVRTVTDTAHKNWI